MAIKVLLMYRLPTLPIGAPGGTEVHWYIPTATGTRDAALLSNTIDLMNARTAIMGNNVTAIGFRLSIPGVRNRSLRVLVGSSLGAGLVAAPIVNQGSADIPNSALQLNLYSTKNQRRNMYLMGLPDAFITTATGSGPDFSAAGLDGYQAKWNAWKALLLSGNWGFYPRADLPAGQPLAITGWLNQADPPFELQFTIPDTAPWGVGDVVHIRRVLMRDDTMDRPVGRWLIRTVASAGGIKTYTLRNSAAFDSGNIEIPGTAESVGFEYIAYTDLQPANQTSRKRGVGPVRPRGRSRRRRRRVVS